ncbi:MAG: hypothetical protein AB7S26_09240 [Sandaracinaceae bacterium]
MRPCSMRFSIRGALLGIGLLSALWLLGACAETERCPDASVFDDAGRCVAIPDAGPADASSPDGG